MVKLNTKFNKILAVMLSLLIIFAAFGNIIPYVVQAEEADSDVIVISSARELIEFANNCKYDSYSRGRTVRLATDINLSNTDFQDIPYFIAAITIFYKKMTCNSILLACVRA